MHSQGLATHAPKLYPVTPVTELLKKRTHMCFLYIGSDEKMIEHFNCCFEAGYTEVNLSAAALLIKKLPDQHKNFPDVLFIDVPYNEIDITKFSAILQDNILFTSVPVIYNEKQLTDNNILRLHHLQVVDDIMTLDSDLVNYFSKIAFLKQSKIFQHFYASKGTIKPHGSKDINLSSVLKRSVDIAASLICLILLSPVFLLIALIIKLESRGPVFYNAKRAGKGFKVFRFHKFRSMHNNADTRVNDLLGANQYANSGTEATFFKVKDDPRVTRFGRLLRNTSADELPQLFNVLKGDMSLVGNRPLPLYEAEKLTTNQFVERFNAAAGITGLWQVKKRGQADMSDEERINLDIMYSRDSNFLYDLKILARTPVALFQKTDV